MQTAKYQAHKRHQSDLTVNKLQDLAAKIQAKTEEHTQADEDNNHKF